MHLRDRRPTDLTTLSALLRGVHEADGYPTVWPSDPARWLTGEGAYGAWVAELDGAVLGQVGLAPPSVQAATAVWTAATQRPAERLAEVTRLFAAPDARGTGVGRHLLQHATDAAHQLELWPVLDVRQDGRPGASRLYRAAGWSLAGSAALRLAPDVVLPFDCWIGPRPGGQSR